jgi:hypothetical protein
MDRARQGELPNASKNPMMFARQDAAAPVAALARQNSPVFYSAVEHAVNNIQQPKMNGDQWLGTLANKPGVKPEELEWTGLKDWLGEQKGQVSKEQIKQFLDENKVKVKDINKNSAFMQIIRNEDGSYNVINNGNEILYKAKDIDDAENYINNKGENNDITKNKWREY